MNPRTVKVTVSKIKVSSSLRTTFEVAALWPPHAYTCEYMPKQKVYLHIHTSTGIHTHKVTPNANTDLKQVEFSHSANRNEKCLITLENDVEVSVSE